MFYNLIASCIRTQSVHRLNYGLAVVTNRTAFYSTEKFENAKVKSKSLTEDPGNDVKLKMYGLFKQGTEGAVQTKRPGMTDFVGRAKWDAWKLVEEMSKELAQKTYIDLVDSLAGAEASSQPEVTPGTYKHMIVEVEGGIRKVTINRPAKKNALLYESYVEWMSILDEAEADPKTVLTVFTGAGDYYCSGNDLSNFSGVTPEKIPEMAKEAAALVQRFVAKHIEFTKPLVAIVNGPAVGIAVTMLGHFDLVYASDRATFVTPFSSLGQSPEGCSSLIFPQLMGHSKACEMILFNKKITAKEAYDLNFVTEVFSHDSLYDSIWPRLQAYAKLPKGSLVFAKKNIVLMNKDKLHEINRLECETLEERFNSDDCKNAIMKFFNRKSKL